jgi:hypothetical protein
MAGYIGSQTPVVSNGSQRKYTFTATAAQTVFTGMDIPNPQQIQVFQNGVRLVITTDYTVSSGTTVTLVNAASAGDSLVVILFADYQLLDTDALTFTGGTTIEGGLTVDNDGATVLTVDRATSDGTLVDFQKDGSAVGSLGVNGDRIYLTNAQEGIMIDQSANNLSPTSSTGTFNDNAMNLGESGNRWKDLYLSGGVYLGGTGSANLLDDYEEGTFTPTLFGTSATGTATYGSQAGSYTKVGDQVTVWILLTATALTSASGSMAIGNLPFSCAVAGTGTVMVEDLNWSGTGTYLVTYMSAGTTYLRIFQCRDSLSWQAQTPTNAAQGYYITHTYKAS